MMCGETHRGFKSHRHRQQNDERPVDHVHGAFVIGGRGSSPRGRTGGGGPAAAALTHPPL